MNASVRQHLIDPAICIRCNTCEESCPINAITHDTRNYVVRFDVCNGCLACIPPCPTGAIDNWRQVVAAEAYSVDEQLTWDELPAAQDAALAATQPLPEDVVRIAAVAGSSQDGMATPPWSAAHPYINLYGIAAPLTATVAGNYRLTSEQASSDIHHIVLDFGARPFPVLEGQSLGILPPGQTADGKPHHVRLYSIASPRDGERPHYNNVALTVKRVTRDAQGQAVTGVASNYLCDLKKGDQVQVVGPYGSSFLMPNHPGCSLLMICTGTGAAPMRAMTERRRRRRSAGDGRLMLFFGARAAEELPYFGPLTQLPSDFIDINFAFSRRPGEPKQYVQDLLRQRAEAVLAMLLDTNAYIFICGLKGMETGVIEAFRDICRLHGQDWDRLKPELLQSGRLHIETY